MSSCVNTARPGDGRPRSGGCAIGVRAAGVPGWVELVLTPALIKTRGVGGGNGTFVAVGNARRYPQAVDAVE
jgi:hypothetical protein